MLNFSFLRLRLLIQLHTLGEGKLGDAAFNWSISSVSKAFNRTFSCAKSLKDLLIRRNGTLNFLRDDLLPNSFNASAS